MYCKNCGNALMDDTCFCTECGTQTSYVTDSRLATGRGRTGYSERIHDPAFNRYVKNTNRWSVIFSIILAVAAIIGFSAAGELGADNMDNPQAFYIGLSIGGMFLCIAFFQIIGRKRSKTWDGMVLDKTIKKKSRRKNSGNGDYYIHYYTEYEVIVRDESGKTHRMTTEDDDTCFNYFKIGDRVRHHTGLNSYEKYDKSHDSVIFCNACATLCDINDDFCWRCKCPLLNNVTVPSSKVGIND